MNCLQGGIMPNDKLFYTKNAGIPNQCHVSVTLLVVATSSREMSMQLLTINFREQNSHKQSFYTMVSKFCIKHLYIKIYTMYKTCRLLCSSSTHMCPKLRQRFLQLKLYLWYCKEGVVEGWGVRTFWIEMRVVSSMKMTMIWFQNDHDLVYASQLLLSILQFHLKSFLFISTTSFTCLHVHHGFQLLEDGFQLLEVSQCKLEFDLVLATRSNSGPRGSRWCIHIKWKQRKSMSSTMSGMCA
jgi:hypothetical protein